MLVFADSCHESAPRRQAGALYHEVKECDDSKHQQHETDLVPRFSEGLEGQGDFRNATGAVGGPDFVFQDQAKYLPNANRCNRKVIASESNTKQTNEPADDAGDRHCSDKTNGNRQPKTAQVIR